MATFASLGDEFSARPRVRSAPRRGVADCSIVCCRARRSSVVPFHLEEYFPQAVGGAQLPTGRRGAGRSAASDRRKPRRVVPQVGPKLLQRCCSDVLLHKLTALWLIRHSSCTESRKFQLLAHAVIPVPSHADIKETQKALGYTDAYHRWGLAALVQVMSWG